MTENVGLRLAAFVGFRSDKGELCIRAYLVMLGYWSEPTMTAQAIDETRWMHTGNLATMDEERYVDIGKRIKNYIIRGHENVYPREIEECFYLHPDIIDVKVIGVPDAR